MSENSDIKELKAKITWARTSLKRVCTARANLADALSGMIGVSLIEFEFPEPDIAHTYQVMFGIRMPTPCVYSLSFGKPLKWIGVSHPWGIKPADISIFQKEDQSIRGFDSRLLHREKIRTKKETNR